MADWFAPEFNTLHKWYIYSDCNNRDMIYKVSHNLNPRYIASVNSGSYI